jgi:hypothetical protein
MNAFAGDGSVPPFVDPLGDRVHRDCATLRLRQVPPQCRSHPARDALADALYRAIRADDRGRGADSGPFRPANSKAGLSKTAHYPKTNDYRQN